MYNDFIDSDHDVQSIYILPFPDMGSPDQDPMSKVGYPRGVVGFHGLFLCKPLGVY